MTVSELEKFYKGEKIKEDNTEINVLIGDEYFTVSTAEYRHNSDGFSLLVLEVVND